MKLETAETQLHSYINLHIGTDTDIAFDNHVALTFDLFTSLSVPAEVLP